MPIALCWPPKCPRTIIHSVRPTSGDPSLLVPWRPEMPCVLTLLPVALRTRVVTLYESTFFVVLHEVLLNFRYDGLK